MTLATGQRVLFGRPNGEKTACVVLRVAGKSLLVQTLEPRSTSPTGSKWRVAKSLIHPMSADRLSETGKRSEAERPSLAGRFQKLAADCNAVDNELRDGWDAEYVKAGTMTAKQAAADKRRRERDRKHGLRHGFPGMGD